MTDDLWHLAHPQRGRWPLLVLYGLEPTVSRAGNHRLYYASRGIQAVFAALNYAWLHGPALLVVQPADAPIPMPWAGMLQRILTGCGAGVAGVGRPPSWLGAGDHSEGLWRWPGVPAPLGCVGANPGLYPHKVTLLVGDRTAPRLNALPDWPFVSIAEEGCASWLTNQVPSEGELCWVNAYAPDGKLKLMPELIQLPWRQVIAFGGAAAKACEFVGLQARRLHHPMFWYSRYKDKTYMLPRLLA